MTSEKRRAPVKGRKRLWIIAAALAVVVGLAGIVAGSTLAAPGAPISAGRELTKGVVKLDLSIKFDEGTKDFPVISKADGTEIGTFPVDYVLYGQATGDTDISGNPMYIPNKVALSLDKAAFIASYNFDPLLVCDSNEVVFTVTDTQYTLTTMDSAFMNVVDVGKLKVEVVNSQPLPTPEVVEGHTFTGWYLGTPNYPDAQHPVCGGECTAYEGDSITADITLHAHYAVNVHTVTFDVSGGTTVSAIDVDWDTALSGDTLPTTTRTGYDFVGWYNGETEYKGEAVKSDITLTAKWEIKTFKVTFYGVDGEVFKEITVNYGTTLQEAAVAANVQNMALFTASGERLSLANSAITDNTAVLTTELSQAEKIGAFLGRNIWLVWTACGVIGFLVLAFGVSLVIIRKRG